MSRVRSSSPAPKGSQKVPPVTHRNQSDPSGDCPSFAEVTQLVESLPSKQMVAGSSPVFRSGVVQGMATWVEGPRVISTLTVRTEGPGPKLDGARVLEPAFVQGRAWGHVTEEQGPGGRGGRPPRNYKPGFAGETPVGHQSWALRSSVEHGSSPAKCRRSGFDSHRTTDSASVAQLVEPLLPKQAVAGSSPVARSSCYRPLGSVSGAASSGYFVVRGGGATVTLLLGGGSDISRS